MGHCTANQSKLGGSSLVLLCSFPPEQEQRAAEAKAAAKGKAGAAPGAPLTEREKRALEDEVQP